MLDSKPVGEFSNVARAHLGRRLEFDDWTSKAFRCLAVSFVADYLSDEEKAMLGLDFYAQLLETRMKLMRKLSQMALPPPLPASVFDHSRGPLGKT